MINKIHQTPDERLANSSETLLSKQDETRDAIQGLHQTLQTAPFAELIKGHRDTKDSIDQNMADLMDIVENPKGLIRKMDEVKSAHLITNKELKKLNEREKAKVEVSGINVITLKGDKGDRGDKGDKGDVGIQGIQGIQGEKGDTGEMGPQGIQGISGKDGIDGLHGKDGNDGKDADINDIEPTIIAQKLESLPQHLDYYKLKNLPTLYDPSNSPVGIGGGANQIIIRNAGIKVSDYITELNFSTNLAATYSNNGVVTVTASGGGSTIYAETPSGLVNGSNKVYTTAHTITTVINFAINGQFIHPSDYSVSGSTITFITALDASLSGTGFTIVYQ
jgi:hypothetical protein